MSEETPMDTEESEAFLTDEELAKVLRISVRTLRRYVDPKEKKGADIRKIKHFSVGGNRRWSKKSMEEVTCS
jgi:response regulator of citrate/malate metabolism